MKPLHRVLATMVDDLLMEEGIEATASNCIRYLTSEVRRKYRIGPDVPVNVHDWKVAIGTAIEQRRERYVASLTPYQRKLRDRGRGPTPQRS